MSLWIRLQIKISKLTHEKDKRVTSNGSSVDEGRRFVGEEMGKMRVKGRFGCCGGISP
ncbi:hypothetical protein HAX54_020491, partial [Datura stramonium]|nr:hypothetical protein [Datura stramonium]